MLMALKAEEIKQILLALPNKTITSKLETAFKYTFIYGMLVVRCVKHNPKEMIRKETDTHRHSESDLYSYREPHSVLQSLAIVTHF